MPFQSEKQRRFLWAEHPEIAKRWAREYPESNKDLPMYARADKDKSADKSVEKQAALGALERAINGNAPTISQNDATIKNSDDVKAANSGMVKVDLKHSDKPTYAGEEREKGELDEEGNPKCGGKPVGTGEEAISAIFGKLSAVLARPLREAMEAQKALEEGRDPLFVPENLGVRRYSIPSPGIAPPIGMTAPTVANPTPQPVQQPGQPNISSANSSPVGGGSNPQHNPIQAFGPLGAKGQLNGNAAFGVKNSPDSLKTAATKLRTAFRVVAEPATYGADRMWRAFVGNMPAGLLATKTDAVSGLPQIVRSEIFDKFRGMGLGKKMYMDVARQAGRGGLLSDTEVAPAAQRVWQSLQRRGRGVALGSGVVMGPANQARIPFNELARQLADPNAVAPSLYKMTVPPKITKAWGQGPTAAGAMKLSAHKVAGLKDIFGQGTKDMPPWYGAEGLIEGQDGHYRYGVHHSVGIRDKTPGWLNRIFNRSPYLLRDDVPKYKKRLKQIRGLQVYEDPDELHFSHSGQLRPETRQLIEAALAKHAGVKISIPSPSPSILDDTQAKQADLTTAIMTAGLGGVAGEINGAMTAPRGHLLESMNRGLARGTGAGLGAGAGLNLAHLVRAPLPVHLLAMGAGGMLGDRGARKLIGKPSWEQAKTASETPAWQRAEGQSESGGLSEAGRRSYERETGGDLKAPVTESNPSGERAKRQNSFCSRMCGMKRVNTGSKTKADPDSRINKSLRKWNCKCGSAQHLVNIALGVSNLDLEKDAGLFDPIRNKINEIARKAVLAAGVGGGLVGGVTGGLAGGATGHAAAPVAPVVQQATQQAVAKAPLNLTAKDIKQQAIAAATAKAHPTTPAVIHAAGPVYKGAPAISANTGSRIPEIKAAPSAGQQFNFNAPAAGRAALPPGASPSVAGKPGVSALLPVAALTALGSGVGAYQAPQGSKAEGATRGGIRGLATGAGGVGGATLGTLLSAHPLARLGGAGVGAALGYGGAGLALGKPSWQRAQA